MKINYNVKDRLLSSLHQDQLHHNNQRYSFLLLDLIDKQQQDYLQRLQARLAHFLLIRDRVIVEMVAIVTVRVMVVIVVMAIWI